MRLAADILLYALLSLAGIPVAVFLAQILASLPRRFYGHTRLGKRPGLAVLMPAHDEAAGIARTVAAVCAQLRANDRLLVVADNCTDETAAIAKSAGAEVIARTDPTRRGKGYALDHGLNWLAASGPRPVVIIIDADCLPGKGLLDVLARHAAADDRPIQAAYVMTARRDAPAAQRIAAFACAVKTRARPLGWARLGGPCQLAGTGMALPWRLAVAVDCANGHLTEDLKLGLDLALIGAAPRFCPDVEVLSALPESEKGRRAQQTRWEHGHLALIPAYVPRLLAHALRARSLTPVMMALDLAVPPLVTLAFGHLGLLSLAGMWALVTGHTGPLLMALILAAALGLAVLLAAARWGRGLVGWRDLAMLPRFALGKLPILLRFVRRRETEWIRTDRSHIAPGPKR